MGNVLVSAGAIAALSLLTIARPRLAFHVLLASVPTQVLFVPVGTAFLSPADVAVAAGALAFLVRLRTDPDARRALRQHAWLGAMIAAYLIGFLVLGHATRTLIRVALAVVPALLACELLRTRTDLSHAGTALIVAACFDIAVVATFFAADTRMHPTRFAGPGGPNFSAIILVVATAIAFSRTARTNKPLAFAASAALAVCAMATLSKMAILALVVTAALVVPLMTRRNRIIVGAATAVIVVVVLAQPSVRGALWERTQPAMQNDGVNRSSAELRWAMAVTALRGFLERPLTGLGFGRFQEYSLTHPEIRAATAGVGFGTHNTYLEVLTEGGLLAFVPFLLYFFQYRGAPSLMKRVLKRHDTVMAGALIGLPIVLLCAALGNFLLYYTFWAVNGVALAGLNVARAERLTAARAGSRVA